MKVEYQNDFPDYPEGGRHMVELKDVVKEFIKTAEYIESFFFKSDIGPLHEMGVNDGYRHCAKLLRDKAKRLKNET